VIVIKEESVTVKMKLIDLIRELEDLYYSYDEEYHSVMGEPEIMIDTFDLVGDHKFEYAGFGPEIYIDKSADGVYDIIRAFKTKEEENGN
jgi:hypothetical protein